MRIRHAFFILFFLVGTLQDTSGFASEIAGKVSRLRGEVTAKSGEMQRKLSLNDDVFVSDKLSTGADARVEIRFHDGSSVTLGQHTVFSVHEFHHNEGDESVHAVLEVTDGAFRATTSKIFKAHPKNVFEVRTATAVIGARGTDFWGGRGKGLWEIALLEGTSIYVENAKGRVEITTPGFGTDVSDGAAPTTPHKWAAPRVERALNTVAWD